MEPQKKPMDFCNINSKTILFFKKGSFRLFISQPGPGSYKSKVYTHIAPKNGWLEYDRFLFGGVLPYFQGLLLLVSKGARFLRGEVRRRDPSGGRGQPLQLQM